MSPAVSVTVTVALPSPNREFADTIATSSVPVAGAEVKIAVWATDVVAKSPGTVPVTAAVAVSDSDCPAAARISASAATVYALSGAVPPRVTGTPFVVVFCDRNVP